MVSLNFLMFLCVLIFSEDIVDQKIREILIESILEGKVSIRILNDMKLKKQHTNLFRSFWTKANTKTSGEHFVINYRSCLCDSWKPSLLSFLIFNWRTFSRRATARWWRQWAKNQVLNNQNLRNRCCQIVRRSICIGWI